MIKEASRINSAAAYIKMRDSRQAAEITGQVLAFAKRLGWHDGLRWFIDQPTTRKMRPRLQDLQEDVAKRQIGEIIFLSVKDFCECVADGIVELDQWAEDDVTVAFVEDGAKLPQDTLSFVYQMMKSLRNAMMTMATERAYIRCQQRSKTRKSNRKRALIMYGSGASIAGIASKMNLREATVKRMIHGRGCYGEKKELRGNRKVNAAKAYEYWDKRHMSYREISRALGISPSTALRYVDEELGMRAAKEGRKHGAIRTD